MDIIYEENDIKIYKQNTLILGSTISLKNIIKKGLSKYSIVDNSFSYSTKTVGETITNYNFNISNLTEMNKKDIDELTFGEYYYLAILIKMSLKPEVLVIDNLFGYLNNKHKQKVINLAKKTNVTLVIFDNELYYSYDGFNVIVIYNNKTAVQGEFKDVVLQEKILKRLGYELPFYVDLSTQLKLYGVVDKICYQKEDLEELLWK